MDVLEQVCDQDQADRLKELGITQKSLYYHTHGDWGVMPKESIDFSGNPSSAFTVSEILCMLQSIGGIGICRMDNETVNFYWQVRHGKKYEWSEKVKVYYTMAECITDRLIHVIEAGKLTVEQCNLRLEIMSKQHAR